MRGPHSRMRRGFGGRGGHFGRHMMEGFERGGRLLGHGDLRYVILFLLEEKPRHGYEMIKALEELSHGIYSPSPGSIYPTLTFLEEGGFATATTEENKKLYTITEAGKKQLDENREFLTALLERFARMGEKMSRFRHWMGREEAEDVARDDRSPIRRAMHGLKAEIFHFVDADKPLKQKVADAIDRAVTEIRKLRE